MKKSFWMLIFLLGTGYSTLAQSIQPMIEVLGKSTVKEIPEIVEFTLPIKIIDSTFGGCSEQLLVALNRLQSDFVSEGLDKDQVTSSEYAIGEYFEFINGKRVNKGYRGTVNVKARFDYSQNMVNRIIALTKRHRHDFTIHFQLSEKQKKQLTAKALEEAVKDAKTKAEILAAASGVELGEIYKITYGQAPYHPAPLTMMRSDESDHTASNELSLSPPMISTQQTVSILWEIDR